MLEKMMLNVVGEGERTCPRFPLTALSRSHRLPSYPNYFHESVGGELCVQCLSPARTTAFIFLYQNEREGEPSFQRSPSRSARRLSSSSVGARGNHHWEFAPQAPPSSGISPTDLARKAPVVKENENLNSSRYDEVRRT